MRCKVGDLAYVRKSRGTAELTGRFVIVVRRAFDGEIINGVRAVNEENKPGWLVEGACGLLPWRTNSQLKWVETRPVYDDSLTPIRPGSLDEETTESRELEAA